MMPDSETVISARDIGKAYMLSHEQKESYVAFRDVLAGGIRNMYRRLLDPSVPTGKGLAQERFWALKDVSFDISRGERIGVIGRNGAGKSTLLKVLARITEPTLGEVMIRGRVSSLLEVGTGFHPELTGRENIYLNGAILGMKRAEISNRFDEIVAFAEVERFLDTPVKRYSSGMYVRLAFAVAAHLEPEILIVDEVLAVGDLAFQRKCVGKMQDVSAQGRTLLFVSHSMPTVTSLCEKCILLDGGSIAAYGPTSDVVMAYYSSGNSSPANARFESRFVGDDAIRLWGCAIKDDAGEVSLEIQIDAPCRVEIEFEILSEGTERFVPNIHVYTAIGECAFVSHGLDMGRLSKGHYVATCHIPANFLNEGVYFVGVAISSFSLGTRVHFFEKNTLSFNVSDRHHGIITRPEHSGPIPGVVRPALDWGLGRK